MEAVAQMHRMAAYRIHQSLVEKPMQINKFWPLPSDNKVQHIGYETTEDVNEVLPKDLWEQIKKSHKIK